MLHSDGNDLSRKCSLKATLFSSNQTNETPDVGNPDQIASSGILMVGSRTNPLGGSSVEMFEELEAEHAGMEGVTELRGSAFYDFTGTDEANGQVSNGLPVVKSGKDIQKLGSPRQVGRFSQGRWVSLRRTMNSCAVFPPDAALCSLSCQAGMHRPNWDLLFERIGCYEEIRPLLWKPKQRWVEHASGGLRTPSFVYSLIRLFQFL